MGSLRGLVGVPLLASYTTMGANGTSCAQALFHAYRNKKKRCNRLVAANRWPGDSSILTII
jgi:hypothetical protein